MAMKWHVCVLYDASVTVEVEADTEEEAKEKAMDQAGGISLCHQCSDEIELGDALEAKDAWLPG
jgi:hypothetical protein